MKACSYYAIRLRVWTAGDYTSYRGRNHQNQAHFYQFPGKCCWETLVSISVKYMVSSYDIYFATL